MANRVRAALGVGAAALGLLAVGLVVFLGGRGPSDFGWYAYSPLGNGPFQGLDGAVLWSRSQLLGAVLAVVGLVLIAGSAGYLLGTRRRTPG